MGFDGIEWRGGPDGHAGLAAARGRARRDPGAMDDHGLVAISVTTYTDFVHPDAAVRQTSVDELVGHAEVAAVLGAPMLRAFPGERADDAPFEELLDRAAEGLLRAAERLAGAGVSRSPSSPTTTFLASDGRRGAAGAHRPARGIGVIWDAGNTWSVGEAPEAGLDAAAALAALRPGQGRHGPAAGLAR